MKRIDKNAAFNSVIKICEAKMFSIIGDFDYKNNLSKVLLKCKKCGYEWSVSYSSLVNANSGCYKCTGKLKRSQSSAIDAVAARCLEANCELVGDFYYKNKYTRLKLRCKKDNSEWECSYDNFIRLKTGCPKCSGCMVISNNEAHGVISKICANKNYTLLSDFVYKNNRNTKFKIKCNTCGYEWMSNYNLLNNMDSGCRKCATMARLVSNRVNKTDVDNRINEKCISKNCILLSMGEYTGTASTILTLKCNTCGYVWSVNCCEFISKKSSCPKCKQSKLEKTVCDMLDANDIHYTYQYRSKILGKQSIDVFIHELNIAIECQGVQHFISVPFFKGDKCLDYNKRRDRMKRDKCSLMGIELIYFTNLESLIPDDYIGRIFSDKRKLLEYIQCKVKK